MNSEKNTLDQHDQIDRLVLDDANVIRTNICKVYFIVASIIACPALAASLYRIGDIGFQPVMIAHVALSAVYWTITFLRHSLPYAFLSRTIVILNTLVALTGMAQFGLVAGGICFAVIIAPLSAIFCGRREAIGILSFMGFASIVIAALFVNGHLSYPFNPTKYALSPSGWAVSLTAWLIASGSLAAALVTFQEGLLDSIAQSKKQEVAIRTSEDRLRLVLEGSQLGFWDWNPITDEVYFSQTWKSMLGFADDEIANRLSEWDKRVHPDDKEAVYADLEAHLKGDTPFYENEHRMLCKDGSYKWVLDRGQVMRWTEDGRPLRVSGTRADITLRKEAELKNQRLTQELQAAIDDVKVLSGLLPICASCKNVRDDNGYWSKIEMYISRHSQLDFSHGICPDCAKTLYPDIDFGAN